MKALYSILFAALLASSAGIGAHAEESKSMPKEVEALLDDYLKDLGKVKEPNDKVLRAEATKIAVKMVSGGDAGGATRIGEQVESKIAGRNIAAVDPQLASLFEGYDSAVASASKPIRAKYSLRADSLLRGPVGKNLDAVVALGQVKKFIADDVPLSVTSSGAESAPPAVSPASAAASATTPAPKEAGPSIVTSPAMGKKVLSDLVKGTKWEYRYGPDASKIEIFSFEKDGMVRRCKPEAIIWTTAWIPAADHIMTGNNLAEFRFDVSGTFGELLFLKTNQRIRITPSELPLPAQ